MRPRGENVSVLLFPVDDLELFAAILGVMIDPVANERDLKRARAYAAQFLAITAKRSRA
jgi:hypothetical protein